MVLALALGSQHQHGDRRIHTDKQADNSAPPRIIKADFDQIGILLTLSRTW